MVNDFRTELGSHILSIQRMSCLKEGLSVVGCRLSVKEENLMHEVFLLTEDRKPKTDNHFQKEKGQAECPTQCISA